MVWQEQKRRPLQLWLHKDLHHEIPKGMLAQLLLSRNVQTKQPKFCRIRWNNWCALFFLFFLNEWIKTSDLKDRSSTCFDPDVLGMVQQILQQWLDRCFAKMLQDALLPWSMLSHALWDVGVKLVPICTLAPYDISKGNIIHELYSHWLRCIMLYLYT